MTLGIADKYDMKSIFAYAQKDLLASDFIESDPLTALGALPRNSELEHISALVLQNLHNYHFECKMIVRDLLASASWAEGGASPNVTVP